MITHKQAHEILGIDRSNGGMYNTSLRNYINGKMFDIDLFKKHKKESDRARERLAYIGFFLSDNSLTSQMGRWLFPSMSGSYLNMSIIKKSSYLPFHRVDNSIDSITHIISKFEEFIKIENYTELFTRWEEEVA